MKAQVIKFPTKNTVIKYHYNFKHNELTVKYVACTVTYVDVSQQVYTALRQSADATRFILTYVVDRCNIKRRAKQCYSNNVIYLSAQREAKAC